MRASDNADGSTGLTLSGVLAEAARRFQPQDRAPMGGHGASFGIGFVGGLRTMTASAALSWAAALGRTRIDWIPSGSRSRGLATVAALGEMAGDKMPFAPDRRILPSFVVRLAIGAVSGAAFAERDASLAAGALSGAAGAVIGTWLGRAARGANTRSGADWRRALTEDMVAAALAVALVSSLERRSRA